MATCRGRILQEKMFQSAAEVRCCGQSQSSPVKEAGTTPTVGGGKAPGGRPGGGRDPATGGRRG